MLDGAAVVQREMRPKLLVQPVGLVLRHRQKPERAHQLVEVARGGRHGEQRAAGGEDARHLGRVPRCEDAQDHSCGVIAERQGTPSIGTDGGRPRVGSCGAAQGGGGCVEGKPDPIRQGVEYAREVLSGAGAEVHDGSLPLDAANVLYQGFDESPEVAGGEERVASLHHGCAIARTWHEIHVALARDVVGMALGAAQQRVAFLEAARADRAAEQLYGLAEHRGILAAMKVIRNDELRNANNSLEFEGADHGGAEVSFFLLNAAPGRGPSLHTHEYAEVFIVLQGQATFRGPDGECEVTGGHVGVVPAGEPHAFVNSGDAAVRQVNIHASPRFVTEWLEEEVYG